MNYNPNKHHRRSIRLKGYDYSQEGLYFITICCQDRLCRFGQIKNGKMILNEFGQIAFNEWKKTPELRKNVELGEFIIMPNHIHGIIQMGNRTGELNSPLYDTPQCKGELNSPLYDTPQCTGELNSPQHMGVYDTPLRSPSQTIGAIVRGYKSSVTKQLRLLGFDGKLWQRNYYENIIRDENAYQTISNYIITNPIKWHDDRFHEK